MHEIWMVLFFPTTTPKFIEWFGADAAFWVNSLFAIVMTLLSSAVLYLTIERPCMKMRRG